MIGTAMSPAPCERSRTAESGKPLVPRWLRFVLASDRAGSAWYIGTGFFFAPVLAVLSPWPVVTAVLWVSSPWPGCGWDCWASRWPSGWPG